MNVPCCTFGSVLARLAYMSNIQFSYNPEQWRWCGGWPGGQCQRASFSTPPPHPSDCQALLEQQSDALLTVTPAPPPLWTTGCEERGGEEEEEEKKTTCRQYLREDPRALHPSHAAALAAPHSTTTLHLSAMQSKCTHYHHRNHPVVITITEGCPHYFFYCPGRHAFPRGLCLCAIARVDEW